MGVDMKRYCLKLIDEVPQEMYLIMLIIFTVGTLILIGIYGAKKGFCYFGLLLLIEYVFLLFSSTFLFRSVMTEREYNYMPFWSYRDYFIGIDKSLLAENFMNVIVFVPVGLLVGIAFRGMNWMKALVIGLGLSIGIEVLQFLFKKGFSEVDDVIHNTLGCVIGYGLFCLVRILFKRYDIKISV